jgi:mevalonate kinase
MSELSLSVPGKTFLAGEYLALVGGPSLILATGPRFSLKVRRAMAEEKNPFHPASPAGLFYQKQASYFRQFALSFSDPYEGLGGFGASSAQFVLLHALWQMRNSANYESQPFLDWHETVSDYRQGHQGNGYAPSGADVMAQSLGGLTYFQRRDGHVQTFAWPFEEEILLFHSGKKVPTHEHLKEINDIPEARLSVPVQEMKTALQTINSQKLISALKEFTGILAEMNYVLPHTLAVVRELEKNKAVKVAKGCGALGADVILVIVEASERENVIAQAKKWSLRWISGSRGISNGFQMSVQSPTMVSMEA